MNPLETVEAIDAASWRDQKKQRLYLKLAWEIAMLSRQKRIPPLRSLLSAQPSRKLRGKELREKRADFKAMASPKNIALINAAAQKLSKK